MATDDQNALDLDVKTDGLVISDYVHPHSMNAGLPVEDIKPPKVGKEFEVDEAVFEGKSSLHVDQF